MSINWNLRFKKMYYGLSTDLGNPLYKREDDSDKNFIKAVENDADYKKQIGKVFSSPSNVRSLIIGINKFVLILHCGVSEGSNKVIKGTAKDWFCPVPNVVDGTNDRLLELTDKVCSINDNGEIKLKKEESQIESFAAGQNPLAGVKDKFIFSNLEEIIVSWNAFSPIYFRDKEAIKSILDYSNSSNRFLNGYYMFDDIDTWIENNYEKIKEYAGNPDISLQEVFPELSDFKIVGDNDKSKLNNALDCMPGQWSYDSKIVDYNNKIAQEAYNNKKEQDENNESQEEKLNILNPIFKQNFGKAKKYCKRLDYSVKLKMSDGSDVYDKTVDYTYKNTSGKVIVNGTIGEQYPVALDKAQATYIFEEDTLTRLNNGEEVEVKPQPNAPLIYALQVTPVSVQGVVQKEYGNLSVNKADIDHGNGDWIICYEDDTDDLFVVNGKVFENTYQLYGENKQQVSQPQTDSSNGQRDETLIQFLNKTISENIVEKVKSIYSQVFLNETFGVLINNQLLKINGARIDISMDVLEELSAEQLQEFFNAQYNVKLPQNWNYAKNIFFPTIKNLKDLYESTKDDTNLHFPYMHLILASRGRIKGWKDLDSYLNDNNKTSLSSVKDLGTFLVGYISNLLYDFFEENKLWEINQSGHKVIRLNNNKIQIFIHKLEIGLCTSCFVQRYLPNTAIDIMACIHKDSYNKDTIVLNNSVNPEIIPYSLGDNKNSDIMLNSFLFAMDKEAYKGIPFFASKVIEDYKNNAKNSDYPVIVGRDYDNKLVNLKMSGAGINNQVTILCAGSRSGKGVLTLCMVSEALAANCPVIYLDCKPDMAKTFNNYSNEAGKKSFAIDGLGAIGLGKAPGQKLEIDVNGQDYLEYAKSTMPEGFAEAWSEQKLSINKFVDIVAYTKGIEIVTDIIDRRAQGLMGKDKPMLVVIDEIEQYAKMMCNVFLPKTKKDSCDCDAFIESSSGSQYADYIDYIKKWIRKTWGNFGRMSNSQLALNCNVQLFIICQHMNIDDWCDPIAGALNMYSRGCRMFLGNETQSGAGSNVYGLNRDEVKSWLEDPNKNRAGLTKNNLVGMGKFVFINEAKQAIPIRSCLLVNESTDKEGKASVFTQALYGKASDPEIRKVMNLEIYGKDSKDNLSLTDTKIQNKLFGFTDFTQELIGQDASLVDRLEVGYEYCNNYTQEMFEEELFANLYNFKPSKFGGQDEAVGGENLSIDGESIEGEDLDTSFIDGIETFLVGTKSDLQTHVHINKANNCYTLSEGMLNYLRSKGLSYEMYTQQLDGSGTYDKLSAHKALLTDLFEQMKQAKKEGYVIDSTHLDPFGPSIKDGEIVDVEDTSDEDDIDDTENEDYEDDEYDEEGSEEKGTPVTTFYSTEADIKEHVGINKNGIPQMNPYGTYNNLYGTKANQVMFISSKRANDMRMIDFTIAKANFMRNLTRDLKNVGIRDKEITSIVLKDDEININGVRYDVGQFTRNGVECFSLWSWANGAVKHWKNITFISMTTNYSWKMIKDLGLKLENKLAVPSWLFSRYKHLEKIVLDGQTLTRMELEKQEYDNYAVEYKERMVEADEVLKENYGDKVKDNPKKGGQPLSVRDYMIKTKKMAKVAKPVLFLMAIPAILMAPDAFFGLIGVGIPQLSDKVTQRV